MILVPVHAAITAVVLGGLVWAFAYALIDFRRAYRAATRDEEDPS